MKRKGFTLVELLAVIVILSVIAIITVPIIGNVIEESRKKALEQSAYGLVEAANYYAIKYEGEHGFEFENGKQISSDKLDYKGTIQGSGKLYIDNNGNISLCINTDKYYVIKNYNSGIEIKEKQEYGCNIEQDPLTNKYVAYLDNGENGPISVYTKSESDERYVLKSELASYATTEALNGVSSVALANQSDINKVINNPKAGSHNSLFRGKDVTSYYTDGSLYTRISSGTFEDLYVGDYVVVNNITWRIAGFDVYLHKGNLELTTHHAVIVPDTNLTIVKMNDTNTTVGGYKGSKMYTTTLPNVLTTYITPVFGNHVITYRNLLTNRINETGYNRLGTSTGCANNWEWTERKLDLMSEIQVFGSIAWSSSGHDIGSDNAQLPLFRLAPEYITNRSWYWLRNITDSAEFTIVGERGHSSSNSASLSGGVRPYFYID